VAETFLGATNGWERLAHRFGGAKNPTASDDDGFGEVKNRLATLAGRYWGAKNCPERPARPFFGRRKSGATSAAIIGCAQKTGLTLGRKKRAARLPDGGARVAAREWRRESGGARVAAREWRRESGGSNLNFYSQDHLTWDF